MEAVLEHHCSKKSSKLTDSSVFPNKRKTLESLVFEKKEEAVNDSKPAFEVEEPTEIFLASFSVYCSVYSGMRRNPRSFHAKLPIIPDSSIHPTIDRNFCKEPNDG